MLHIFTLSWNGENFLRELYPSLLLNLNGIEYKWWIKDNGSKDNTLHLKSEWNNERVEIIDWKHNRDNYARGNNILYNLAKPDKTDFILTLNNDLMFKDAISIANMIEIAKNETVGQVGAKLNYKNNEKMLQHAGIVYHKTAFTPINYRAGKLEEKTDRQNRYFPMITGAVALTKAHIWNDIQGFDEKYNWMFEDCDMSLKIRQLNKEVVYCGKTHILHEESASLKKNPVNKLFFTQNIKLFQDKWKSAIDPEMSAKYDQDPTFRLYGDR
jgi:GT2 family glycosyltransferase